MWPHEQLGRTVGFGRPKALPMSRSYTNTTSGCTASEGGLFQMKTIPLLLLRLFFTEGPWFRQPSSLYHTSSSIREPLPGHMSHLLPSVWVCLPWRAVVSFPCILSCFPLGGCSCKDSCSQETRVLEVRVRPVSPADVRLQM